MEDYEYLLQRSTLIDRLGAKARATPSEVKRDNNLLEDVFVTGATANTADIENRDIASGRFFSNGEDEAAARVAYIGADVATKLFPAGNTIGSEITIRGLPYLVIADEAAKSTVLGIPQGTFNVLSPITYSDNFGCL